MPSNLISNLIPSNFTEQDRQDLDNLLNNAENIAGHVNTFADLPAVLANAGLKYIVDNATGVWGVNRKPAGTYLSTGTIWTSKFNAVDVINVLTSTQTQKALSANMGRLLDEALILHEADNANPHDVTFTQSVTADPNTDITAAEAETLTDGSNADTLHEHALIKDAGGTNMAAILAGAFVVTLGGITKLAVDAVGNLVASAYPQDTRNDTTVNDEKVLTTDVNGNLLLRRVLPFSKSSSNNTGGVNQTTTLTTYMTLTFTVLEAGDYIIDYSYIWSYNATTADFECRILLDGATIIMDQVQEPQDSGGGGISLPNLNGGPDVNTGTNQRFPASGFSKRALTIGAHSVQILIGSTTANNEAAIYQGNLRVTRNS